MLIFSTKGEVKVLTGVLSCRQISTRFFQRQHFVLIIMPPPWFWGNSAIIANHPRGCMIKSLDYSMLKLLLSSTVRAGEGGGLMSRRLAEKMVTLLSLTPLLPLDV